MTAREIYNSALCLLAESTAPGDNGDYEERAPYLLAVFCLEAKDCDDALRSFTGQEQSAGFDGIYIPLEDDFPLLDKLAAPAALYLAAMLILDDSAELSDKLYDKYSDAMSQIYSGICGVREDTVNSYFTD